MKEKQRGAANKLRRRLPYVFPVALKGCLNRYQVRQRADSNAILTFARMGHHAEIYTYGNCCHCLFFFACDSLVVYATYRQHA